MSNTAKKVYIHEEIWMTGNLGQGERVTERVCELVEQGYKVKVIEHAPATNIYGDGSGTAYMTTIMASLSDKIEFG